MLRYLSDSSVLAMPDPVAVASETAADVAAEIAEKASMTARIATKTKETATRKVAGVPVWMLGLGAVAAWVVLR